jgi:soluble lytic murein transglycosylase
MAYSRGSFSQAETLFAALARSAPNTAEGESARYWHARALEQQGRGSQASQRYRELLQRSTDGYYTLWAEKHLQIVPPALPLGDEETVTPPRLSPPLDEHYRRSQELRAIGHISFARREFDQIKASAPHEPTFVRFLLIEYSQLEGHNAALRFAQSLSRGDGGNWSRYLFPQAYWETVSAQAREKRLDPYLVLALMRQESLFDTEAVSPARAYGLMQLLPSTAAKVTGAAPNTTLPLTEPRFNIEVGMTYLRQLLDRYNDNLIMAVAAYNAGENAVDKWRNRYPELASDEFVEQISYRETRNYVKQVLRNYRTYLRLYANGSQGLVG